MLLPFGQRRAPRLRPLASEQAILRVYNERDLRRAIGALCAYRYQGANPPRYEVVVAADIGITEPIEFEDGIGDGPGDLVIRCEGSARIIAATDLDYLFRASGLADRALVLRECNIGAPEDDTAEFAHVFSTVGNCITIIERCRISTTTGLFTAPSAAPTVQYSAIRDNYFIPASTPWNLLTTIGMRLSLVQGNRASTAWSITYSNVASVYNSILGNHMRGGAITTTGSSGNSAIVGNTQATITGVGSDNIAGNT